ncbi:MAG: DUF2490 domain-containing protein [Bacteroidales bacterium]|nr:DUF2490 domain-containing protein [Bacteroidales bacterium]
MKLKYFAAILLMAFTVPAFAASDDDDSAVGARLSGGINYKIKKGFHLNASEEIRFNSNDGFDKSYTNVGLDYKLNPYLKVGCGYDLILVNGTSAFKVRHRIAGDITGTVKAGNWKFSLKEKFQGTYRSGVNTYQKPEFALNLKSRFKVAYKVNYKVQPYASVELRHLLNGAEWSEEGTTSSYASASYLGHSDAYMNRVRTMVGVDWKVSQQSAFDIFLVYDANNDTIIDSNKEGSTLKAQIYDEKTSLFAVGVAYTFSF